MISLSSFCPTIFKPANFKLANFKSTDLKLAALTIFCLSLFATINSHAEIYKTIDENDRVVFTDTPPLKAGEAEQVDIDHINTQPGTQVPEREIAEPMLERKFNYTISISNIHNGTKIPPTHKSLKAIAKVNQKIYPEHKVQWYTNGKPAGSAKKHLQTAINLSQLPHGANTITVKIVDKKGKALATSSGKQIYLLKHPNKKTR